MDYGKIANGVYLTEHAPMILVENEGKLTQIQGAQPGTVAYTAGYTQAWTPTGPPGCRLTCSNQKEAVWSRSSLSAPGSRPLPS